MFYKWFIFIICKIESYPDQSFIIKKFIHIKTIMTTESETLNILRKIEQIENLLREVKRDLGSHNETGFEKSTPENKNKPSPKNLIEAVKNGNIEQVRDFLDNVAHVNEKDFDNSTPLHEAARLGFVDCVRELAERGAEINAKDDFNRTPLHMTAFSGYVECMRELIKHGADVNAKNVLNLTPLHISAFNKCVEIVLELLNAGADPFIRDDEGKTPLDMTGNEKIKFLLEGYMIGKK